MAMLIPNLASQIYDIVGAFLVIVSYIFLFGLILIVPILIWSFFRNRNKPKELSEDTKAIISAIRDEFKKLGDVDRDRPGVRNYNKGGIK